MTDVIEHGDPVTRVTVNLHPKAAQALRDAAELTEDTKTQVINKALQVYVLIQKAQAAGGGASLQDRHGAALVRLRFH